MVGDWEEFAEIIEKLVVLVVFPVLLALTGLLTTHSTARTVSAKRNPGRRMVGNVGVVEHACSLPLYV